MKPAESLLPAPLNWQSTLSAVLLHPSLDTFQRVRQDRGASMYRVWIWFAVIHAVFNLANLLFDPPVGSDLVADLAMIALSIVAGPLILLAFSLVSAWVVRISAALFNGAGETHRLAYLFGVLYSLAYGFIVLVVILSWTVSWLTGYDLLLNAWFRYAMQNALIVYLFFLQVQAVRAEENLSVMKAVLVLIFPAAVLVGLGLAAGFLFSPAA